jgi:hypothetical protein
MRHKAYVDELSYLDNLTDVDMLPPLLLKKGANSTERSAISREYR